MAAVVGEVVAELLGAAGEGAAAAEAAAAEVAAAEAVTVESRDDSSVAKRGAKTAKRASKECGGFLTTKDGDRSSTERAT
ncbi:hypothetical protein Tco_1519805, partial [Tanacetum coccineum]